MTRSHKRSNNSAARKQDPNEHKMIALKRNLRHQHRERSKGDEEHRIQRKEFAANHSKWCALAAALGCTAIRVNARGEGSAEEQIDRCADGLTQLLAIAKPFGLKVIVENHGGLSSDGAWVVKLMETVRDPNCGTLPDFGNWRDEQGVLHDPVVNTRLVMPYAKGCSAKSYDFDAEGNETLLNYPKLLEIVRTSAYTGPVGIEYEGKRLSESEGILATKKLLLRLGCVA